MNRVEIEARVAEDTGLPKETVKKVIGKTLDTITEAMARGEDVRIVRFGTFKTVERKERKGKNPADGSEITIRAGRRVSFKPGTELKSAVNP